MIFGVVFSAIPGIFDESRVSSPRIQCGTVIFSSWTSRPIAFNSAATYSTAFCAWAEPVRRGRCYSKDARPAGKRNRSRARLLELLERLRVCRGVRRREMAWEWASASLPGPDIARPEHGNNSFR